MANSEQKTYPYLVNRLNQRKVIFLVTGAVFIGEFIYLYRQGMGFFGALFFSIPGVAVIMLFGGVILEILWDMLKSFWNWLQR